MTRKLFFSRLIGASVLLFMLAGCGVQAPYMKGWDPVVDIPNRWTDGVIDANGLSEDEQATFDEFGTPDAIRFYRTVQTREPVYEWIYMQPFRTKWFSGGSQVDYVEVDTNISGRTTASREALVGKLKTGGLLASAIAGMAMGTVAFIGE